MIDVANKLYVGWLFKWLDENRIPLSKLLGRGKIPNTSKGYRHIHLPASEYLALTHRIADYLDDQYVGLRIGSQVGVNEFGYLGELTHYCSDLRMCFRMIEKYTPTLLPQMESQFVEQGTGCFLSYELLGFDPELCRYDSDLSLVSELQFFRQYIGADWLPDGVQLRCSEPENVQPHKDQFGENVRFNQPRDAIHFSGHLLETPVSEADPYLLKVFFDHLDRLLEQISARDQLVNKVRYHIALSIGTDACNAEEIARRLFMSHRTLNRGLKKFGTSFRALKTATIVEMAETALLESRVSITEIALQMGYAEVAAFYHAFKKQTGLSPSEYRLKRQD